MEKLDKGTKVKITRAPAGMERLNGSPATAGEHIGKSGETQLFDLAAGGGLFLSHDCIEKQ